MPFRSKAQRRKFYVLKNQGKLSQKTIDKWEKETTEKDLPEMKGKFSSPLPDSKIYFDPDSEQAQYEREASERRRKANASRNTGRYGFYGKPPEPNIRFEVDDGAVQRSPIRMYRMIGKMGQGTHQPPPGFQPVRGSKRGGYKKMIGGKWVYWYPGKPHPIQARKEAGEKVSEGPERKKEPPPAWKPIGRSGGFYGFVNGEKLYWYPGQPWPKKYREAQAVKNSSEQATAEPEQSYTPEKPPKGTPRAEAKEELQEAVQSQEYVNDRASRVEQRGEDVFGSARHKAVLWKGLRASLNSEDAEKIFTKKFLTREYPPDFVSIAQQRDPSLILNVLGAHLALQKFPSKPEPVNVGTYVSRKLLIERVGPDYRARASVMDHYHVREAIKNATDEQRNQWKEEAKALSRQGYFEAYTSVVDLFQRYALSQEKAPKDAYQQMRRELNDLHRNAPMEQREVLRKLYNATRIGPKTSSVAYLNRFLSNAKQAGVYPTNMTDSKAWEGMKEVALEVIDGGKSVDAAFGKQTKERKNRFKIRDAYNTDVMIRKGDPSEYRSEKQGLDLLDKHAGGKYGMRGVQWGKSVTDDEREHHLKSLVDSFHDLSTVLNLPPEMASFNGKLAIAVGARGKGSALAHYESENDIINLTRAKGAGALAHEWGHFFDFTLGKVEPESLTRGSHTGPFSNRSGTINRQGEEHPVQQRFSALMQSPEMKSFKRRLRTVLLKEKDSVGNTAKYWTSDIEVFARCFECHVKDKLTQQGRENTYLTGVLDEMRTDSTGLWPTKQEAAGLAPYFDKIFEEFRNSPLLKKALRWLSIRNQPLVKKMSPPAGYQPIPNSKHGGYRKRKGSGWDYWYPDQQQARPNKSQSDVVEPMRSWIDSVTEVGLPRDTQQAYKEDGEYSEKRMSFHERVYPKFLDHVPSVPDSKKPVAIVMMGGSASGKGTVVRHVLGEEHGYVNVNPDDCKEEIPEYQQALNQGKTADGRLRSCKDAAAMAHEESSDMAEEIRKRAIASRKNVLIDGTGKNVDKYASKIEDLKKAGYHVRLLMPHVDMQEAQKRAKQRAERSGRYVPDAFVEMAHHLIPGNFEKIAESAHEAVLFDNAKPPPRPVWTMDNVAGSQNVIDESFVSGFKQTGERRHAVAKQKGWMKSMSNGKPLSDSMEDMLRRMSKDRGMAQEMSTGIEDSEDLERFRTLIHRENTKPFVKSDQPPPGYQPIPGSKHGGYRKRKGSGWDYWYPNTAKPRAGGEPKEPKTQSKGTHEVSISSKNRGKGETTWIVHDPSKPGDSAYHEYTTRGKTAAERKRKALEAHASRHGIEKKVKNVNFNARARNESFPNVEQPETGKAIKVATVSGVEEIEAHTRSGIWAAHAYGKGSHAVTHVPTGMRIKQVATRAEAAALARHMSKNAPEAWKDAKFGKKPSDAEGRKQIVSAMNSFKKSLSKAVPCKILKGDGT